MHDTIRKPGSLAKLAGLIGTAVTRAPNDVSNALTPECKELNPYALKAPGSPSLRAFLQSAAAYEPGTAELGLSVKSHF